MATSTNFGWTEPDDTDLVKNGASAMRTLGNAIDSSLYNAVGKAAGKNAVINGGFDIWQRGTSIAQTAGANYTADRWQQGGDAPSSVTVSRQTTSDTTNLPNIQYCARVQRNASSTRTTGIGLGTSLESVNCTPYIGKIVTVSFYMRAGANFSSASNALRVRLLSSTTTDNNFLINGGTDVVNQSITLTTTWQRFTYTSASAVSSSAVGLGIVFDYTPVGTAGAADYFEVTGVQLELGSSATPFSRAGGTIQGELAACQRYYWRATGVSGNANPYVGQGSASSSTGYFFFYNLPVPMRTQPTTLDSSGIQAASPTGGLASLSSLAFETNITSPNSVCITATASGLTTSAWYYTRTTGVGNYLGIGAEL